MKMSIAASMPVGSAGAEVAQLRAELARVTAERDALRILLRRTLGRLRDVQRVVGGIEGWMQELEGGMQ